MLASIAVVVLAVLTLLITGSPDSDPAAATTPEPTAAPTERHQPKDRDRPEPPAKPDNERDQPRRERPAKPSAYVEVFNNSGVTGLAGATADRLSGAGWQVVGTDNWYGDIPATTVYYPPRLRAQAALLADQVGATRVRPAVDPMRFDRLTLILTGDL